MELVINKVQTLDPNNSEAVKEALSVFFQNLIKQKEFNCNKWLRELKNVINRFPKYCMQHRSNAENYLANFLSSNNYFNVIEAAKCAHALQQVRPTKEKTATPKSSWRDQMSLLCNTSHTLISAVFPNAVDMYKDAEMPQTGGTNVCKSALSIALTDVTKNLKNVKDKQSLLQTRLQNVLVFIQAMLVEIYPTAKPIRPQIILDVIVRTLSVTSRTNSQVNIVSVKKEALRTLDALIVCLGSNLIPFSPLVIRCVMQTLRWTSDNSKEDNRKVRSTAYNTLCLWLNTLHVHRTSDSRNLWEDELTGHIVNDITPLKKIVQLTMGPQPTKNLSKKAKRKLAASQLQESTIAAHMPGEKNKIIVSDEANNEVAIAALECAEMFLTVCGRFLKPATHKLIQETLVRECYNHSSYTDNHLLYLLRALEATRKTTPVTVPPPTQYCLHLYSVLVNVQNSEIAKFCTQALLDIRLHLHCSPPSLNFTLEQPKEAETENNIKKKISGKNREVLQSLLGPDKVPSAIIEDEIITISDEPTNKKPRLEIDEADRISLSSDSVKSVEMCDDSENNELEIIELNKNNGVSKHTKREEEEVEQNEQVNGSAIIQESKTPEDHLAQGNVVREVDNVHDEMSIYEASTQMPLNTSSDTIEEEKSLSQEVGYDYPNGGTDKITVLETLNDENIPSTNETDDIEITCGQVVRDVEEIEPEEMSDDLVPKVNGVQNEFIENGINSDNAVANTDTIDSATLKLAPKNDGISVEDMLADFVDEVITEAAEA